MKRLNFRGRPLAATFFCITFSLSPGAAASTDSATAEALDPDCVMSLAATADGDTTLAQVRERCAIEALADPVAAETSPVVSPVEKRLAEEREAASRPFSILAHRPNYFLAAAYNGEGWSADPFREASGDPELEFDDVESQFQISLKVPLAIGLFGDRMDVYGAYTNRSFWQMYNSDYSELFRETNHEPEIWAQFRNDWQLWGLTNSVNTVGWIHQSNGRGGDLSRSWNRFYATFLLERGGWALAVKPWVWVSKDKQQSDNPDIDDYMGHGELRVVYGRNGHVFSAMARNQLESGFDRGALELSWSFPVFDYPYLKGYVQYFHGYGESLIDYNQKVNRLGIGISVTDWLD